MPVSHDLRCALIHVPKSAGTSIVEALDLSEPGHGDWRRYHDLRSPDGAPYFTFSIVRNPWDRVVSCYTYARMERSYYHTVSGPSLQGKHPDHDLVRRMTFAECVGVLHDDPDRFGHAGWRPQYPYVTNERLELEADFCGRYERLEQDFRILCARLGVEARLDTLNSSRRSAWPGYYSRDTFAMVADIYEADIELFGYERTRLDRRARRWPRALARRWAERS